MVVIEKSPGWMVAAVSAECPYPQMTLASSVACTYQPNLTFTPAKLLMVFCFPSIRKKCSVVIYPLSSLEAFGVLGFRLQGPTCEVYMHSDRSSPFEIFGLLAFIPGIRGQSPFTPDILNSAYPSHDTPHYSHLTTTCCSLNIFTGIHDAVSRIHIPVGFWFASNLSS